MMIQEFDYSVNLIQALLWQYDEAVTLISLMQQKQDWYDANQEEFWANWFNNVFNLLTANTFGLCVWSIILNIPLFIDTSQVGPAQQDIFGFNDNSAYPTLENSYENFNSFDPLTQVGANFSNRGSITVLTPEEQRFILRLRYFQLATRGDITDINSFLNYLFSTSPIFTSGQTCYAVDNFDMTMRYVFNFDISQLLLQILKDLDLLPRPSTVGVNYYISTIPVFGFGSIPSENNNQNFGNGNFYSNF